MSTIDEILKMPTTAFADGSVWRKLDEVIEALPDFQDRIRRWQDVLAFAEASGITTGHVHFRLGILHLLTDADEATGLHHLESAYKQDQQSLLSCCVTCCKITISLADQPRRRGGARRTPRTRPGRRMEKKFRTR